MPVPPAEPDPDALADAVLARVAARRPGVTICPSEVARALATDEPAWRALMPAVRDVARTLARAGRLRVSQRGRPLDPDAHWHGPIRLAAPVPDAAPAAETAPSAAPDATVPPPAGDGAPTDSPRGAQVATRPADAQR